MTVSVGTHTSINMRFLPVTRDYSRGNPTVSGKQHSAVQPCVLMFRLNRIIKKNGMKQVIVQASRSLQLHHFSGLLYVSLAVNNLEHLLQRQVSFHHGGSLLPLGNSQDKNVFSYPFTNFSHGQVQRLKNKTEPNFTVNSLLFHLPIISKVSVVTVLTFHHIRYFWESKHFCYQFHGSWIEGKH